MESKTIRVTALPSILKDGKVLAAKLDKPAPLIFGEAIKIGLEALKERTDNDKKHL